MSAEVKGDITQITDEDLLRRMWQQAEDFSRKKEIRAHMYKIREQRLKDFYTSGEVLRDVQRSNSSPGLREGTPTDGIGKTTSTQSYSKTTQYTRGGDSGLTHADSLTDQSFLSLKSKEIRDSESPTRDISYRSQDIVRQGDHDWNIVTSKETSEDGKTHSKSRIATTSGTREIDGGINKFAAVNEENKFETNDGDENNFSRTVGGSSKAVAEEHFVSGDDNNFRTSTSKTTSSSSHVVKHFSSNSDQPEITYDTQSNYGDDYNDRRSNTEEIRTNYSTNRRVTDNNETNDYYRKNNRYQDEVYTNKNESNYRKNEATETNRKVVDTSTTQFQHDTTTDKSVEKDGTVVERVVKLYKSNDPNLPDYAKTNITDGTTKIVTETRTLPDGSSITKTKYETVGSKTSPDICAQSNTTSQNRHHIDEKTSRKYDVHDTTTTSRNRQEIDEKTSRKYQNKYIDETDSNVGNVKSTIRITRTQYEDEVDDQQPTRTKPRTSDQTTSEDVLIKTTVESRHRDTKTNDDNTEFINIERKVDQRKSPEKYTPSKQKKSEPNSSPSEDVKVSKDHYTTTYQTEFTNKKISVEVSPQHDAFAKSLRTTPERTSPNRSTKSPSRQDRYGSSDTFTRSQTDITTTRRTTSPYKDSRSSPTRKSPSKESSPSYRQSPERKPDRNLRGSPERSVYPSRINEEKTTSETKRYTKTSKTTPSPERKEDSPRESIYTTDYCTDTIKKRKPVADRESSDRKPTSRSSPTRNTPRSDSPTKVPRDKTSPTKSYTSPTKDKPTKTPSSRESSPNTDTFTRPRKTSPSKESPRETSPNTDTFTRRGKSSPTKEQPRESSPNTDTFTRHGKSSPTKEKPRESSPNTDTFTRPRKSSPTKESSPNTNSYTRPQKSSPTKDSDVPKNYRPQPDADEDDIGIKSTKSTKNTEITQETVTTTIDSKRKTSGGILKNTQRRPSEDIPKLVEPYQETTVITTEIDYMLPSTQIITDLDSNETITITLQPDERPSTLKLQDTRNTFTNELIETERNVESCDRTTISSPQPKPVPSKDSLISPNPDETAPSEFLVSPKDTEPKTSSPSSPKKERAPLRRKDTYADKCAELLGLIKKDDTETVETSKTVKKNIESTTDFITNEQRTTEKSKKPSPEKELPSKHKPSAQSPTSSPDRKSPSKTPDVSRKSPNKEIPDKTTKRPSVQEFPAQRRSPDNSPERKLPSSKETVSKKSPIKQEKSNIQEYPAQTRTPESSPDRKTPRKVSNDETSLKKRPNETTSKPGIQEFPAQRRSPESSPDRKTPKKVTDDENFPNSKKRPNETARKPSVQEFPSQRRSPESSPDRKTPRKSSDDDSFPNSKKRPSETNSTPGIQEFPSQKRSPDSPRQTSPTKEIIETTTTTVTRKSSLKKPKDSETNGPKSTPTDQDYPIRSYDTSPDRKTSEYSSCDETTIIKRKSSLKKPKLPDTPRKSPTKETPNESRSPDSSPDRRSPIKPLEDETTPTKRKSSLKQPKAKDFPTESPTKSRSPTSSPERKQPNKKQPYFDDNISTAFIINEQTSVTKQKTSTKDTLKKTYKPEDLSDESDTDSDTEGGDISETESYKYIKNVDQECYPENIETTFTTKQTTDFNETDFVTAKITTETVTTKVDNEIKRPLTPSRIPMKKTPDSSPDRKSKLPDRKTPTSGTSPDRKTTTYNLIRNERIQNKPQSPESSPDQKTPKKIPTKSSPEKKPTTAKPLTKQGSTKEIPTRPSQPSPDRRSVSKTPSRSSIKTPEQPASGKTSPTKLTKSPNDTKRPSISSPSPKSSSASPKTIKPTPSKPSLPRRHTDESLTGKTPTKSQPKTTGSVRTVTTTKTTKTTSVSPVLKKTNSTIDNKFKKQPIKNTVEYDETSESEIDTDFEINEEGSLITNVSILDTDEFTNDTITIQNHKNQAITKESKTYTSDYKITKNGTSKSPITNKSKPELTDKKQQPSNRPSTPSNKIPVRKTPLNKKKPDIKIATKTITLTNTGTEQIVIDIQQSKSSREPSAEHIWPCPVSNDSDTGKPRHPDNVCEPDDQTKKGFKVSDITLTEGEDVDFNQSKITDVTDDYPEMYVPKSIRITDVDKVLETDESLLSVSDKVSKFLHTAENLTKTTKKDATTAPKVPRPELVIDDERLISDECLLSVSDKVSKFLTTAEQLTTTTTTSTVERPKSPRCRNYEEDEEYYDETDECLLSVNDKVNRFTTTVEQVTTNKRPTDSKPAPKVNRPDITDVDEELREDECLLSVSDKVNKFLTTAEQLTTTTIKASSTPKESAPRRRSPEKEPISHREEPKRQSPVRRPPIVTETVVTTKTTTTPKQLPKDNDESPKRIYETPKAPRSSEAVRKAKALFENISNTQQETVNKQRAKPWETKTVGTKNETTKLTDIGVYKKQTEEIIDKKEEVISMRKESLPKTTKNTQEDTSLKSTKLILNKPSTTSSSTKPEEIIDKPESPVEKYRKLISQKETNEYKRASTPKFETKQPGSPLKPQVNGIFKEEIEITKKKYTPVQEPKARQRSISPVKDTTPRKSVDEPLIVKKEVSQLLGNEEICTTKQTKFGVVLKRTDSGRTITTTEQRRRSMSTDPKDHQPCIEDIEDLCLLEQMLEKVSGYEQRRRIRAQIRVVKKLIQDGKISSTTTITTTKRSTVSPSRKSPERKIISKPENTPRRESADYNEKSYMRQTLTSEKKVSKTLDDDVSQGYVTRTTVETTHNVPNNRYPTSSPTKKARSPSPKQRSPSPGQQNRTSKVTDYSQPTASWVSRTTTSTTNHIKKARSPSPKQRSPSPQQQNRTPKITDYSQPTAAWALKTTNSRTDLKKIIPKQKPQEDQPEWVTQRILRKVDGNNTRTSTQTTQRRVTTLSELKSKKDVPKEFDSSPSTKEIEPTECITSSYGVGPTDEIGRPLFGLKALRHQASFNEKTQVRGTMVSSSYYSENGSEPVGEVTVTQYSSDPAELGINNTDTRNRQRLHGLASITTTQKFGKNSPAALSNAGTTTLKAITTGNKETENNDVSNISKTVTSRITRRGSVKEMSKKFIENAVETVQTERKSSYPKAGLILRTSSFKDQIGGSDFDSRASTPGMNDFSKTISLESMESASEPKSGRRPGNSKTFLNTQTRVTGVQDVISRMKNSTNESEPGECADDAEARALLNKFLGAQVLMTGMESMMGKQQKSTTVERRSIVTSSSKQESSSPQQVTSISHFTRPITLADIENIWDESILRLLLTTSTSYEERRIIRARLRQVMAEQEACANIVASMVAETKATELSSSDLDSTSNATSVTNRQSIQGESLLLPLLKELLDKQQQPQNTSVAAQNSATILRTNSSQSSDESGQTSAAIEDSGTESGEDLRLLAAGICDSIEQQRTQNDNKPTTAVEPLGPGLLSEVLSALNRLQTSLQLDSKEVILDPTRKLGLLQLVTRLQASLVPATVLPATNIEIKPVEKSTNQSRFAKRKDRKNRHTVGVSSEELADARRLMEEMAIRDTLTNVNTPEDVSTPPEFGYAIQKQKSDGNVIPPSNNSIKPQYKPVSFNVSAKPFQSESFLPNISTSEEPYQHYENVPLPSEPTPSYQIAPSPIDYSDTTNITPEQSELDEKSQIIQVVQKAALVKQISLLSEKNDDDTPNENHQANIEKEESPTESYNAQDNPGSDISEDVSSAQRLLHIAQDIPNKPLNRFNNKKLRMKRANTIDIPKPINFYRNDDDSDSSIPDYDGKDSAAIRKNNYLALRGPIRVSNNTTKNTTVPSFEAKTDNDKKFLAFIKKHETDTNNHKVTSWMGGTNHVTDHLQPPKNHYINPQNWNNAFGSIKTIFENNSDNSRSSSTTSNSARKFWQTNDDFSMNKKPTVHQQLTNQKPTNSTQNFKKLFEQKQEEAKLPWSSTNHQEVITGSVKIDPHANSGDQLSVTNVSQRYIPKPIPVNKFSHAPMSAFKPIPKRTQAPPTNPQFSPLGSVAPPRYVTPGTSQSWAYPSPKNVPQSNDSQNEYNQHLKSKIPELAEQFTHPPSKSPTNIVPWATNSNPNEKRVLALAASKFENPKTNQQSVEPPKVLHREKVYVPPVIKDVMAGPTTRIDKRYSMHEVPFYNDNLTSPQLVQKFEHNQPRKLSEDYQSNISSNQLPKTYNYQPNNEFDNNFAPIEAKVQTSYSHQNGINYEPESDDYSNEIANIQMKDDPQNYYEPKTIENHDFELSPQQPLKIFDFPSPELKPEKTQPRNEPEKSENSDLTSLSLTEYKAVSKVMKGPVSQSAVTVTQNTPKRREEEIEMANSLKSSLQNFKKQDDNSEQKLKQQPQPKTIEKIISPKAHRRSLSNERHKRSNSIGRKLDRQDSREKKKEKVQSYIKREEKIIKPNVQISNGNLIKKLNERGLPYEEPKIQGNAFRRLSADSVVKKENEKHKMYENPLYSPTATKSNNMFAAKYEYQKSIPPKIQSIPAFKSKEPTQPKPSYQNTNSNAAYITKQPVQNRPSTYQENKPVPTYQSKQAPQTKPYQDNNYAGYSSQCVVSNKSYNIPPEPPKLISKPTLASTNHRQLSTESIEFNDQGESVVTSKLQIPVSKDKFLPQLIPTIEKSQPPKMPSPTTTMQHKTDSSWQHISQHQIPLNKPPSPRGSPRSRYLLQKAKSSHNLAVPTKQFEAGITREDLVQKKKTVEAFFTGSKSPNALTKTSSQTSINERKTSNHHSTINRSRMSERISTQSNNYSGGLALSRSRTMPQVVFNDIPLLDEKQVETTKKTVQEGPTTTTEVTTTRITTQRAKPVSPFAKFRQLDKQNSLSSSSSGPNSPKTPGGAGGQPLFKFTDPTLRNSASTVKDRLLYWCQVKTKEYKNVQIDNFSTSWADGLAFCALIHHFRPDAFDYDALTPQQRRHNFSLAFRVADEIAGIAPLLDVEDMVMMRKPDWKCVFTYVQSIYRRFKDEEI